MTRKRFVKLLMSEGWNRNSANAIAGIVREKGFSYQIASNAVPTVLAFEKIVDTIRDITEKWCNVISPICETLSKAINAFCETINEAMQD